MKATVIVPVYNEPESIGKVLEKIGKGYEVIVVDDGSGMDICDIAGKHNAKCIRLEKNMGKGYACRIGAQRAKCSKIIFIDGDLQLDPAQIHEFVKALDRADMVIGCRRRKDMPFQRVLSNAFAAFMIFLSTRRYYSDVLCGFRAVRKEKFNRLELRGNRYEFESEFMIKAAKKGLSFTEIPVNVTYRRKGMGLKDSIKVVFYQLKEIVRSF